MSDELRIGKSLNGRWVRLPLVAVTETFAILGKRGGGKTHTASVLAEEMLELAQHVVVIDPLDVWYGLRALANGKGAGYPVVVFGGTHGDFPLNEDMGKALADLIVEERIPAVLSLRHMRKNAQKRFVTDFAEQLYHRKGEPALRVPLHLMIDEADAFCPQRVLGNDARMVGAVDDLVRRGRSVGIGVTVITQRPASINKDVLTQTEVLITHKLTGPHDRKAVKEWVEYHGSEDDREAFLRTLSSLPVGTAWVWSTGLLDIFERVAMRGRRTFDSSATPKPGEVVAAPKSLAVVDVAAIEARLKETIERVAADDPKVLKQRVAELERALGDKGGVDHAELAEVVAKVRKEMKERFAVKSTKKFKENALIIGSLQRSVEGYRDLIRDFQNTVGEMEAAHQSLFEAELKELRDAPSAVVVSPPPDLPPGGGGNHGQDGHATLSGSVGASPSQPPSRASGNGNARVGKRKGKDRMLIVLAQHGCSMTDRKLGILAGLTSTSGTFSNYLSALRREGLIEGERGSLSITAKGEAVVGEVAPLPVGAALHDYWAEQLGNGGCRRMFCALVASYPESLARMELGERVELSAGSGTFSNYLSKLRRLGLVESRGGDLVASGDLF